MALYTPFLKNSVSELGDAYGQNLVGKLTQRAYLGDDNAMAELARYSPQAVQQIQQQRMQQSQAKISMQAKQQEIKESNQKWAMENKQMIEGILKKAAQMPTFEDAQQVVASDIAQYKQSGVAIPDTFSAQTFTPQAYEQAKKVYPAQVEAVDPSKDIIDKATGKVIRAGTPKSDEGSSPFLSELNKRQSLIQKLATLDPQDPSAPQLKRDLADINNHIAELAGGGSTKEKAPSGYQFKPDGTLEPIRGGPADKEQNPMGAREQVFLQRVLLSANEASKDLANIVELPTTSSTGIFGGRQQGGGLLAATKEVMANKMTSQEAQSYNTLASGFQRALAGIESAGLAPTNALSHQMDAVLFKEGDTNLTKLQKMAQIRQIVEAGLESTLANPRMPDSQRKHAEEVIDSMKQSIPFTQKDLMKLQVMQEQNPNMTLKQLIAKSKQSGEAPAAAVEHLKSHPELKDQFKEKYGYLPEGF